MKFSYNWLQSFFDTKLPKPEELAEVLTMRSFEVEEIKKKGNDYILNIDILPNRSHDCLSHYGLAREVAALLNTKYQIRDTKNDFKIKDANVLNVKVEDKSLCERYTAYVVEGIKIMDSPDWIKERLASVEQKSINNVVDITNYIVWELGQPLHAFDFAKIKGPAERDSGRAEGGKLMNIRPSKEGEELETLDGVKHKLDNDTIIIEDRERLIDLAGIKGGANTQIDNNTKAVVFQAAIFNPMHIRHASQRLSIRTDAAVRYMHGFDPELPSQALDRAFELVKETNPDAKIVQKVDIYPSPAKAKKINLDFNYANNLLGIKLEDKDILEILNRLGFFCEILHPSQASREEGRRTKYEMLVTVPSYRLDVNIPEDVIEEIGRIYGYENIKENAPQGILISPRRNEKIFWRNKTREILAGFGFSEVYNYSLTTDYKMKFDETGYQLLELLNPISEEFQYFRIMILPGMLSAVSKNAKYFDRFKLFEIGSTFYSENGKVDGGENMCVVSYGSNAKNEATHFYEIKGYIDEFLNKLGITDFYYDSEFSKEDEVHGQLLHPARCANIFIDNKFAGFIGEVHLSVSHKFDIKGRVYAAELDFTRIIQSAEDEHIYQKSSKYPEVVRDIAVLVPRGTTVEEVLNAVEAAGGKLLRDTDLFDMYEGENLPEGMTNLAFHLLFQSDERTLTSSEIDDIMNSINEALSDKGLEVR